MLAGLDVRQGIALDVKKSGEYVIDKKTCKNIEIKPCINGRVKQSVRKCVLGGVKKEKRVIHEF